MLTFAPDLFSPSLVQVFLDGTPLGTITEQAGRYTATSSLSARSFSTRKAAVAYLTTGKATALNTAPKSTVQLTLF